jgi:hypothetical protein
MENAPYSVAPWQLPGAHLLGSGLPVMREALPATAGARQQRDAALGIPPRGSKDGLLFGIDGGVRA